MSNENAARGRRLAAYAPTLAEIGAVVGASARWIGHLRSRGVMPPDGATLAENVAAWVAHRIKAEGHANG